MAIFRAVAAAAVVALLGMMPASAQQVGTLKPEEHPPMPFWTCTEKGCTKEMKSLAQDSNWRWIHNGQGTNCYDKKEWDATLCPDPETCAANCHLDGITSDTYASSYGVFKEPRGVKLKLVTKTPYGKNIGSRLYLMDTESTYQMFKLKNMEFSITVDASRLPCGINGAVYFVEMDADGGKLASAGTNTAGAKYGTGYCDAQCPHDMKFIKGKANVLEWNSTLPTPIGKYGSCCAEMDIWEANSRATAYTAHPCNLKGSMLCDGVECGDTTKGERYKGVCDKDGCDSNAFRLGNKTFYGRTSNMQEFDVNSRAPIMVVTQFVTSDGTDTGDLVDIRRFYMQNGKLIPNANSSLAGVKGNSLTKQLCDEMKAVFGDTNDFAAKGGLKAMGEALDRGVVLALSLWDDDTANMLWLDSAYPPGADPATPGILRGPCKKTSGKIEYTRKHYPRASVRYLDLMVGKIGTTSESHRPEEAEGGDEKYGGDDRRLSEQFLA